MPSKRTMSRWLYENLKGVPTMRANTNKWKEASSFASKVKTFDYLWSKMAKKICDRTLGQNARSMKESLKAGGKKGKVTKDDVKPGGVNTEADDGSRRTRGRRGGNPKALIKAVMERSVVSAPCNKKQFRLGSVFLNFGLVLFCVGPMSVRSVMMVP